LRSSSQKYIDARNKLFRVIIKQKSLSFFMQGIIIGGFLMVGGFLVINGKLPIGEFVASEIIVVSIISAINRFIKQIDYLYEVAKGFYKVGKLTKVVSLEDLEK
jgi:ABC-type bacteriocin/lantibiotic exporter with double-glycine peptidase domain